VFFQPFDHFLANLHDQVLSVANQMELIKAVAPLTFPVHVILVKAKE
jgi:hypothetical protein